MEKKIIKLPSELDTATRLDNEFDKLISDIEFDVKAISNGDTVTINGVYIPNSQLAVKTAENLCRLSFILRSFED
ncbi:hypothetical protein [Liquorilactobacillus hordei]|uniref:hypothetical protein n=1 Tax=Liquorilactobacillus hordei TaxID=468911 RepID=UPI0039ECB69B